MQEPANPTSPDLSGLDLFDTLLEGVTVHGPEGRLLFANLAAARMLRTPREVLLTRGLDEGEWTLLRRNGRTMDAQSFPAARVLAGEPQVLGEIVGFRPRDGEGASWFSVNAVAREIGGARHVVVTFAEHSNPYGFDFRAVIEGSNDLVLVTDANRGPEGPRIVYANAAFSRVTGYALEEVIGHSPRLLQGPDTAATARAEIREAVGEGRPVRTTLLNYAKNGRPYWLDLQIAPLRDSDGRITHFAAIQRDMSDTHEQLEQALHAASHDPLTGLLNRRGFLDRGEVLQARARRDRSLNALMMIDIDHFSRINERFGHAEGDRVLSELAAMSRRRLRESDLLGRLGGEEFTTLAAVPSASAAVQLAESLRRLIAAGLQAGPAAEPVTVSIGVSMSSGAETLAELIDAASEQLFRAKRGGRDQVAWRAAAENPALPVLPD